MPIITRAKLCTSFALLAFAFAAHADDWKIDLSRRLPEIQKDVARDPASDGTVDADPDSQPDTSQASFFDAVFSSNEPAQEIVLLNTEKGFIPSQIRVHQGQTYKIYVVNVNEAEKNVSFVLDAFSEHHATYYGKIKSFMIKPQKEGVYKFISPETAAQGKLVVAPADKNGRLPASE